MSDTSTPTRTYNLGDLLEIVAGSVPDRLAVVAGDIRYTFAEFDRRTNQVARMLLGLGLEPGAKVAVYSWNRAEWAELFFGAAKARVVPINVNYRYVAHELEYVLDNSDAEVVVFERGFAPVMAEVAPKLPKVRATVVLEDGSDEDAGAAESYEELVDAHSGDRIGNQRSNDDLYFLYTGGTTGMPKGVMWRHEDLFFAALSSGLGPEPVTRPEEIVERSLPEDFARPSLLIAPLMHGAAQWGMCNMIFAGAGVALYTEHGLDPHAVWELAEREKCMGITLVGDAMARPLADALADGTRTYDLSGMYRIGSGGGVFSPAVQGQLKELIPHVAVMDSYGASETGAGGMSAEGGPRRFVVGPELNVLDDALRPVATGEIGLLARQRAHPARLLQGRGQDGGHLPDRRRRQPLVGSRRLRHDRRRRHRDAARARVAVHQHRRREGLPRGGRGGAEEPPRRLRRPRGGRARRTLGRAGRRGRRSTR